MLIRLLLKATDSPRAGRTRVCYMKLCAELSGKGSCFDTNNVRLLIVRRHLSLSERSTLVVIMRVFVGCLALMWTGLLWALVFAPELLYSEAPGGTRAGWSTSDLLWLAELFAYSLATWSVALPLRLGKLRILVVFILAIPIVRWLIAGAMLVLFEPGVDTVVLMAVVTILFIAPAGMAILLATVYRVPARLAASASTSAA